MSWNFKFDRSIRLLFEVHNASGICGCRHVLACRADSGRIHHNVPTVFGQVCSRPVNVIPSIWSRHALCVNNLSSLQQCRYRGIWTCQRLVASFECAFSSDGSCVYFFRAHMGRLNGSVMLYWHWSFSFAICVRRYQFKMVEFVNDIESISIRHQIRDSATIVKPYGHFKPSFSRPRHLSLRFAGLPTLCSSQASTSDIKVHQQSYGFFTADLNTRCTHI